MKIQFYKFSLISLLFFIFILGQRQFGATEAPKNTQDSTSRTRQQLRFLLETLQENAESGEKELAPLLQMHIEMESLDSLIKALPLPEKFQIGDERFLTDEIPLPSIYQKDRKKMVERKGIVKFGGDVLVGRNEIVKGDVVLFGGNAKIYGQVEGGIVSVFGNIKLASTSVVENEVVSIWGNTTTDEGATIHGETVIFNMGKLFKGDASKKEIPVLILVLRVMRFIFLLLFAWIVYIAFPKAVHNVSSYIKNEYARSLVFGFVGVLLVPIVFLVLLATIIGIPVAVIALPLIILAAFILGVTGMAIIVSEKTKNQFHIKTSLSFITLLIGIVIIESPQLLSKIFMVFSPALSTFFLLIGILVFLFLWMPGFGAVIATRFGKENLPPNNHG